MTMGYCQVTSELATRGLDHSGSESLSPAPAQMGRWVQSTLGFRP